MINPGEKEIHQIVQKIVRQTLGQDTLQPALVAPEEKVSETPTVDQTIVAPAAPASALVVAIGTDHGGVDLKETLMKDLIELGYRVVDCGTHTKDAVDYPDFALAVARLVSSGQAWRGVVIDGAGIGSCMAANKVPGVRAAMCYDHSTAVNSREHNNANVLTLGAGLIGINLAKTILRTWLSTEFAGGRHQKRVDKIMEIEGMDLKNGKAA